MKIQSINSMSLKRKNQPVLNTLKQNNKQVSFQAHLSDNLSQVIYDRSSSIVKGLIDQVGKKLDLLHMEWIEIYKPTILKNSAKKEVDKFMGQQVELNTFKILFKTAKQKVLQKWVDTPIKIRKGKISLFEKGDVFEINKQGELIKQDYKFRFEKLKKEDPLNTIVMVTNYKNIVNSITGWFGNKATIKIF